MKKISYIVCLLTLFCSQLIFAGDDSAIYQTEVPVNSQSDQDRQVAVRKGLEQVLIKLSGNPEILSSVNLKLSPNDLTALVDEYGYFKPEGSDQSHIKISFDREEVNKFLKKAKKPIWEAERASILVWATFESPGKSPEVIDSQSANPVRNLINLSAQKRGVTVVFPLMDLTDLNQVTSNDILVMKVPTLQGAGKRYNNSDRMLIVRVIPSTSSYSAQAKLILGHEEKNLNLQDTTISGVLNKLINQIADRLAERSSSMVSENVQTDITMKIVGIVHHEDFIFVKKYLKQLAIVAEVDPIEINGEEIVLHLSLRGDKEGLIQSISSESKLVSEPGSNEEMLIYRWGNT